MEANLFPEVEADHQKVLHRLKVLKAKLSRQNVMAKDLFPETEVTHTTV